MIRRRRPGWFTPVDGSTVAVSLGENERELIASVMGQTKMLILAADPSAWRLFPETYANDPEMEKRYRELVGDDLRDSRLAAIETVTSTLDAPEIDLDQLDEWTRAVNSVRLVLGTALDLTEETEDTDFDPDSAESVQFAVYGYLSALLDEGITVLAELRAG